MGLSGDSNESPSAVAGVIADGIFEQLELEEGARLDEHQVGASAHWNIVVLCLEERLTDCVCTGEWVHCGQFVQAVSSVKGLRNMYGDAEDYLSSGSYEDLLEETARAIVDLRWVVVGVCGGDIVSGS